MLITARVRRPVCSPLRLKVVDLQPGYPVRKVLFGEAKPGSGRRPYCEKPLTTFLRNQNDITEDDQEAEKCAFKHRKQRRRYVPWSTRSNDEWSSPDTIHRGLAHANSEYPIYKKTMSGRPIRVGDVATISLPDEPKRGQALPGFSASARKA
jgi:hypothetical protein